MKTTVELYVRNAYQAPNRVAIATESARRTYRQFWNRVRYLGSALEQAGVSRQGRVGIFALNSIEYFEAVAAAEIGARIPTLLNFRMAVPELKQLLQQTTPEVLIFDSTLADVVSKGREQTSSIRRYICIGENPPDWSTPFEDFLSEGRPEGPVEQPEPYDIGTLFFTGGTTGAPKAVPWTHKALLLAAHAMVTGEDTVLLQSSPAFHTGGRCPVLTTMWAGGTTILERNFDATRWLHLVQEEKVTWTFMVPMMIQAVLDHPHLNAFDLSSLEWVMAASTAIPPQLLERAVSKMGSVFYVAYGSTEGGFVSRLRRSETRLDGDATTLRRLGSVGQVLPWADVVLVTDEDKPVAHGETGEVCVRNYAFSGYWKDPAATIAAMWNKDYVRTGDLGRFDEEGYLFILDRKKDMIISGGENIYSKEVEDALHRHGDVQAASVVGYPDEQWGETVYAFVVPKPGHTIDPTELISFSRTQLAGYKCPRRVEVVDALPTTSAGKVDKIAIRNALEVRHSI